VPDSSETQRPDFGADVGIVVIGRNEGERLRRCLESLPRGAPVVYVDSGSSDGSRELAARAHASVVSLDLSAPFTAARGRTVGLEFLREQHPGLELAQLVDGDCTLDPGWLAAALAEMRSDARLAVVCGRRRERFPEASVYNLLCDLEWDTPVGEALDCGGDALVRITAVCGVGGFRTSMIAGEEPELCFRLRAAGWKIHRIAAEMTLHDAAIRLRLRAWLRAARLLAGALPRPRTALDPVLGRRGSPRRLRGGDAVCAAGAPAVGAL